ncbi:MAG: UTP--glucose-1-phosphate uridylyltransferase [Phycisphaerae bacterium]
MRQALKDRFENCRRILESRGQAHVLRWWHELNDVERDVLLADVESIRWEVVDGLIETHVRQRPPATAVSGLEPAVVYPQPPDERHAAFYRKAVLTGESLIREGKVAALTVAGGQGTRLGVEGPKGTVVVTPVGGRTLFELFAAGLLAAGRRYGRSVPWYIMTSPGNHEETVRFFGSHDYFGLSSDHVVFFTQGTLPAFDFEGRLILAEKHRLALAPDGHGGTLSALASSGSLADMRARGVEMISYFQVDNPLARPLDPLFLGLHAETGSEMSTKVTPKTDDLERMGNVCMRDGKVCVIEYTEFPESCAHARTPDGRRKFDAGNLAIHVLDVALVERVTGTSLRLPFRRADKTVAYVDPHGVRVTPETPNAIKLETFVFDALPLAKNPLALAVDRAEEFSPVKNREGIDSLTTAQRDLVARACRWMEAAGVSVPRGPDGGPAVTVVISPLFALDAEEVREKAGQLPVFEAGRALYLE